MFELFWINYGRDFKKGLAWINEKCKWTGSEANPVLWPFAPQIWGWNKYLSSIELLRGISHPHDGWLEPSMLTVSREVISQPDAEVCLLTPLTANSTPPIPFNEELHGPAGFDHFIHGKDCEKHIYFGNTTYIHLHIYICTRFFPGSYICLFIV